MKRRLPQSAKSTYSEDVVDTTMMDDIESQSKKSLSPISNGERQKKNVVSSSDNNRSWRYRILLRKIIYAIITDLDDETLRRDDTEAILIIITLLKEAMLGVIIAFFLVSFILFVDHRFLLGLPTARNFRKATFAIMNDQETLRNFEENAGLKFMDMEEYDSAMNEVALAGNRTELAVRILKTRSGDLIELKKDLDVIQVEFPAMFSKMGLDRFCDTCIWGPGQRMTCLSRVKALEEKYNTPKYEAMMSAMERKSCVKSDEETEKERKMIVQEDELLKEWQDKNGADWCGECEWDGGMSCQERANYLSYRYGVTLDRAKAKAVISVSNCKMSEHEGEEEKMARLCEQCPWGNKMTCKQRVDYLMYTYKDSERKAILATMEKPSCDANPESK